MSLFSLTPKPIPAITAPFHFDAFDRCDHAMPDGGHLRADVSEGRPGVWWWRAEHKWNGNHGHPGVIDWREKEEAGRADSREDALIACREWMIGRLG